MNILHKFILVISALSLTIEATIILIVDLKKNIKATKILMIKGTTICTQN